jgi:hypothetical protein
MKLILLLLALGLSAGSIWAQGSPPFYTDDAVTVSKKQWELDIGVSTERARDASHTWEFPSVDIAYGLTDQLELGYGTSWLLVRNDGEKTKSGLGNSVVGVKWRFLENEAAGWGVSVNPQFEFNTISSSRSRGLVEDNTAFILPLQFQKSFGEIQTAFNIGRSLHAHEPSETDGWFAGIAVGRHFSKPLHVGVELFGETSPRFKLGWLLVNVGALYTVNDHLSFSCSVGSGVAGDGRPDYVAFFGVQLLR